MDIKLQMLVIWEYENQVGALVDTSISCENIEDLKDPEWLDNKKFYFSQGNLGCDCNRSVRVGLAKDTENYSDQFKCGEEIKFRHASIIGYSTDDKGFHGFARPVVLCSKGIWSTETWEIDETINLAGEVTLRERPENN